MNKQLVWDAPTRLFHWLFAAGFAVSAFIALGLDDDGPLFPFHAIIGLVLSMLVVLRIVWGFVGSKHARFSSFAFEPSALARYLKGALLGGGGRYVGHNPGSAYATFAMLALMIGLAVTGIIMGVGNEGVKEFHEVLAYTMVGVVTAHVLGVILHTIRHRENITAGMIHGRRAGEPVDAIRTSHPIYAGAMLVIVAVWSVGLVRNFDPATRTTTLPVIGAALQLGEAEHTAEQKSHDDDD